MIFFSFYSHLQIGKYKLFSGRYIRYLWNLLTNYIENYFEFYNKIDFKPKIKINIFKK